MSRNTEHGPSGVTIDAPLPHDNPGLLRAAVAIPGLVAVVVSSLIARLALPFLGIGLFIEARQLTGSYSVGGLVTAAYALALGITGPPIRRLVDRPGQTPVLVTGAGLSGAGLLIIAMLPAGTSSVVLIALAAAIGAVTPPLTACVRTLLPDMIEDEALLRRAYAFDAAVNEASWVIGPPLGLCLAAIWSPGVALAIAGLTLFGGTTAYAYQSAPRQWRPRDVARTAAGSLTSRGICVLVGIFALVGVLFGAAEIGVTAAGAAGGNVAKAGPLLAVWGVGGVVGGIAAGRFGSGARGIEG